MLIHYCIKDILLSYQITFRSTLLESVIHHLLDMVAYINLFKCWLFSQFVLLLLFPDHSDMSVVTILVGNKCDLKYVREVSVEEGRSLAMSENLFFIETSALDATNVVNAFQIVIKDIYRIVSRKVLAANLRKTSSAFSNTKVVALQEDCEEEVHEGEVHTKSKCCFG